jgi:hypothetical protein
VKRIANEATKIAQLEITLRDRALTWYMKYNGSALEGKLRSLTEIKRDLLKEFQNPKSEP